MLANRLLMGNLKGEGWAARLVAEAATKDGLARAKFLMPLVVKCLSAPCTSMAERADSSIGLN